LLLTKDLLKRVHFIDHYLYTHASQDDYNHYAKLTGDDGWNWKNIQKYIKKTEKFVAPADGHNTTSQYKVGEPSTTGIVPVSLPGYPTPLDQRALDTTKQFASEFPYNPDMNTGNPLGLGWAQSTIGGGERMNSAGTYLAPKYLSRPNLSVLLNTHVTKLVKTGTKNGVPSFHGVQFKSSSGNVVLHATKEIVISAGSIGTPHLLMLSGIGDSKDLSAAGVKPLVNLPSVGKNMTDHVLLGMVYSVNSTQTFDDVLRNKDLLAQNQAEWNSNKTGQLTAPIANQLGWFRLPENSSIFEKVHDPTVGPASAHWELILVNLFFGPIPATGNYLTVVANLISPTSRNELLPFLLHLL
jgi:choline dehydrogenase-like flavoprotein